MTVLLVEVWPVVDAAVTLNAGKSRPALTSAAPASVKVTVPVAVSIA